jgi:hypothetical protein
VAAKRCSSNITQQTIADSSKAVEVEEPTSSLTVLLYWTLSRTQGIYVDVAHIY